MPLSPPAMPTSKNSTLKTERTHEENQERAYIAASHRTDRSLEARIESARRASEIHKRRTGRALKVTEDCVLRGDVYEDEEDDLPNPCRQLSHCFKTDSESFGRKLANYLAIDIGLRNALSQVIQDSHSLSANAAAGGRQPSFQDGLGSEQSMQTAPFSPTGFPQHQSPISYSPESSNPPTPSSMTQSNQQINFSQYQPSRGTQFQMGPHGLGTLPPSYYQGTFFGGRRQTAPSLQIPQPPANPYSSAVISPEQFHAMSQSLSRRPSASTDMVGGSTTSASSLGSPELLSRRMSASSKISESPLRTSAFSPRLPHRHSLKLKAQELNNNPTLLAVAEGDKSLPQSPTVKRRASADLAEEPSTKSVRAEGSPPQQPDLTDPEFGLFDFSLPQNTRDILALYENPSLMFGAQQQNLSEKPASTTANRITLHTTSAPSYPGENTTGGSPTYNFSDPDLDLAGALMDQHAELPMAFGMSFSKMDNFEPSGNLDEMLRDYYLQKGTDTSGKREES